MERRFAFALAALTTFAAASGGCASEEEAPPAYPMSGALEDAPEEAAALKALEIGDDEAIVDEGNVAEGADSELAENPLAEDEEDEPQVQIMGIRPQAEARVKISAKKYKCPQRTTRRCVCEGSPLNCEMPNDQPGRNRYLPPGFVGEVTARGANMESVIDAGRWEVAPGTTLHDGEGRVRGTFTSDCLSWAAPTGSALAKDTSRVCPKINFGQMKNIKADGAATAKTFVYAFNVYVNGAVDSSGWIPLDSVVQKRELAMMGSYTPRRVRSFVATKYVVKSARDWGQDPATFASDRLPAWAQSKVAPGPGSRKVRDYLLRDGNVINLAYSTPGVGGAATDTFLVADKGLAFRRVRSTAARPTLVRIPVDDARRKSMTFAFGSVGGRFGWLALAAIKTGSVVAAPVSPPTPAGFCGGKADGSYCNTDFEAYGFTCRGGLLVAAHECRP